MSMGLSPNLQWNELEITPLVSMELKWGKEGDSRVPCLLWESPKSCDFCHGQSFSK